MTMTHEQAVRIVDSLNLIGPSHGTIHGDFDRVRSALEEHPGCVVALNALDPERMEETPQRAAAHLRCREILEFMLSRGVKLDIFMACALGLRECVQELLERDPALANARGGHGIHVLNHASDTGIVQLLLEHGADPNALIYAPWGWTPVHEAAATGRREILALLVAAGGSVGAEEGTTPLHAAARNGHRDLVAWLLECGANANARGRGAAWEGKTPLDLACENGHDAIAVLLRRHGANG
jgi:ankyrin repeat protein